MDSLRDWLIPLLDRGRREYSAALLEDFPDQTNSLFNFCKDLSNLRISPRNPLAENLQLRELRWSSSGDLKASSTDALGPIRTVIPRKAIVEWRNTCSDSSVEDLQIGTVIRVTQFEFRVSDCFDPPRPELYIHCFQRLNCHPSLGWYGACPSIGDLQRSGSQLATSSKHPTMDRDSLADDASPRSRVSSLNYKGLNKEEERADVENQQVLYSQIPLFTQINPSSRRDRLHSLSPTSQAEELEEVELPKRNVGDIHKSMCRNPASSPARRGLATNPVNGRMAALLAGENPFALESLTTRRSSAEPQRTARIVKGLPMRSTSPDTHVSKRPRLYDPDRPLRSVEAPHEMTLDNIPEGSLYNMTNRLNSVLARESVKACYDALIAMKGDYNKAMSLLLQKREHSRRINICPNESDEIEANHVEPPVLITADRASTLADHHEVKSEARGRSSDGIDTTSASTVDKIAFRKTAKSAHAPTVSVEQTSTTVLPFQRWRKAVVNGRYLPRYMTKIDKDQTALLETDHSWQPPLAGQNIRPGTLPLSRLNALTDAADNRLESGTAVVTLSGSSDEESEEELPNTNPSKEVSLPQPVESRDEEVGVSEWPDSPVKPAEKYRRMSPDSNTNSDRDSPPFSATPPSPPRRKALLPCDSPIRPNLKLAPRASSPNILQNSNIGAMSNPAKQGPHIAKAELHQRSSSTPGSIEDVDGPGSREGNMKESSHKEELSMIDFRKSARSQQVETTGSPSKAREGHMQIGVVDSSIVDEQQPNGSAPQMNGTASSTTALQKTIQVKRTPQVPLKVPAAPGQECDDERGPRSSPTFVAVPGTHKQTPSQPIADEVGAQQTQISRTAASAEIDDAFEINSSEDNIGVDHSDHEFVDGEGTGSDSSSTSSISRMISEQLGQTLNKETHFHGSPFDEQVSLNMIISSTKRKIDEPSPETRITKRAKTMTLPRPESAGEILYNSHHFRKYDPDYDEVKEDLHRQRREFYESNQSSRHDCQSMISIKRPGRIAAGSLHEDFENGSKKDSNSISDKRHPTSTPLTTPSLYRRTSSDKLAWASMPPTRSASEISQPGHIIIELYTTFKTAYPLYEGDLVQFQTSCQLVKDLKMQSNRAPHPSLWDDFIIRHLHEYPDYVQEAQARFSSILPFVTYYEEMVEDPKSLKRIVRPDFVNMLQSRSNPSSRVTPSIRAVEVMNHALDPRDVDPVAARSVNADSSISNLKAQSTSVTQPASIPSPHIIETQALLREELDYSQENSVKLWIEKAAGAESPVLGTPDFVRDIHIPVIDLDATDGVITDEVLTTEKESPLAKRQPQVLEQHSAESSKGAVEFRKPVIRKPPPEFRIEQAKDKASTTLRSKDSETLQKSSADSIPKAGPASTVKPCPIPMAAPTPTSTPKTVPSSSKTAPKSVGTPTPAATPASKPFPRPGQMEASDKGSKFSHTKPPLSLEGHNISVHSTKMQTFCSNYANLQSEKVYRIPSTEKDVKFVRSIFGRTR